MRIRAFPIDAQLKRDAANIEYASETSGSR